VQSRGYSQWCEHLRRVLDAEYGVLIVIMFSVNFHFLKLIFFWGEGGLAGGIIFCPGFALVLVC